jgi:hypothetical protein
MTIDVHWNQLNRGGKKMRTAAYQKSLTVAFRPEVFQRMKEITDERKTSIAEYVRQAVDEALEKKPSQDELRF